MKVTLVRLQNVTIKHSNNLGKIPHYLLPDVFFFPTVCEPVGHSHAFQLVEEHKVSLTHWGEETLLSRQQCAPEAGKVWQRGMASFGCCRGECRLEGKQGWRVTLRLSILLRQLYRTRPRSVYASVHFIASTFCPEWSVNGGRRSNLDVDIDPVTNSHFRSIIYL